MSKKAHRIIASIAGLVLVAALVAPAALADEKPGLEVQSCQAVGTNVRVVVVNSDSLSRSGLVLVEAVVDGQRVSSVHSVKVSAGSSASISVSVGGSAGVVFAGIITETPDPA